MRQILIFTLLVFFAVSANAQNNRNSLLQEEEKLRSELKVYPNPCKTSKLTIDFTSKEIKEIRISDITGKEVFLKTFKLPKNKTQIELSSIPNGIYLVRVKTNDDKTAVSKLLVSKN